MREVVLKLTTQKDLVKHQSDARTFGELKKELVNIKWSGMRVVERSNKTTLQMDDAVLPQGDFILFLVPEKVKSGSKSEGGLAKLSKPIDECSYNECRSHMSWLNRNKNAKLNLSGGTDDLRKRLKKYHKNMDKARAGAKEAIKETVGKAVAKKAAPAEKDVVAKMVGRIAEKANKGIGTSDNVKDIIRSSKDVIISAIDEILETIDITATVSSGTVKESISTGVLGTGGPLVYSVDGLEKEVKKIRNALKNLNPKYSKID